MIEYKYHGTTILHSASFMGQLDIVDYVLDKGVSVDILNYDNMTPLMYATIRDQIKVINLLLDRGANINYQDKDGWTALHYTCNRNQLECVKVLVNRGIDINLKCDHFKCNYNKKYQTALDIAEFWGYQAVVEQLLKNN